MCAATVITVEYDSTMDTSDDTMSFANTNNILLSPDIVNNYDSDTFEPHSNPTISDNGLNTHHVKVTRYSAIRPSTKTTVTLPDSSGHLYRCFGVSRNGSAMIYFPYHEDTLPSLIQLLTNLQQIQRKEAPVMLRATLGTTETLPLIY